MFSNYEHRIGIRLMTVCINSSLKTVEADEEIAFRKNAAVISANRTVLVFAFASVLLFALAYPGFAYAADASDDFNKSFSRLYGDKWPLYADTSWYHGTGSYTLTTPEQLAGLAKLVYVSEGFAGCAVTLGADIDLSAHEWFSIGRPGDTRTGEGYEPARAFSGVFDGAGHTISGLTINGTDYHSALFGYTKGGIIQNLTVSGEVVGGVNAAGIVAQAEGTNFYNLVNYANVTTTDRYNSYTGGVFGEITGTSNRSIFIQECANYGTITAGAPDNGVGGIGGHIHESSGTITMVKCENHGDVRVAARARPDANVVAGTPGVGGIVGTTASVGTYQIQGCYNDASISCAESISFVGGVAGNVGGNASSVSYSYNVGDVSSAGDAGGVVSNFTSTNGSVACTYNAGTVSASGSSGGIIASMAGSAIHNYYAEGTAASGVGNAGDTRNSAAACTLDYLFTQELLDNLNYGAETTPPFSIEPGKNNGMPILYGSLNPGKGGSGDSSSRGSDDSGEGEGAGQQGDGSGGSGGTSDSGNGGIVPASIIDSTGSPSATAVADSASSLDESAQADSGQTGKATESFDIDALDVGSVVVLEVVPEEEQPLPEPKPIDESAYAFGVAALIVALWGMTWKYIDFYTQRGRSGHQGDSPHVDSNPTGSVAQAA